MYDVLTSQVSEQPYVGRTKRVHVADLEPFILDVRELGEAEGGQPFAVYHGEVKRARRACRGRRTARDGDKSCPPARSPSRDRGRTVRLPGGPRRLRRDHPLGK